MSSLKAAFEDVLKFMVAGKQKVGDYPYVGDSDSSGVLNITGQQLVFMSSHFKEFDDVNSLRARFLLEELGELLQAMAQKDKAELADGYADLIYVALGGAVAHGIDLPAVWDVVQKSNMAKFPNGNVYTDSHGKVTKPPGWKPPQVRGVLENQFSLQVLYGDIIGEDKS